jgi:hypothetical protein
MGRSSASDAATAEYLYVPCVGVRHDGYRAETRRWVQEVPIIKKTVKWIYYASDSWNRREAIVSPGCISREQFEADTRSCPRGERRGRRGYLAGVIPVPGDGQRPGSAGPLFCSWSRHAPGRWHNCHARPRGIASVDPLVSRSPGSGIRPGSGLHAAESTGLAGRDFGHLRWPANGPVPRPRASRPWRDERASR